MRNYRLVIIFLLIVQSIVADTALFDTNCKSCHFTPRQLDMFMARYTLNYSSEARIKKAIFNYLKNPKKENSVMPVGFLTRFSVKKATLLDDTILRESINQYYKIYNLKKRIK